MAQAHAQTFFPEKNMKRTFLIALLAMLAALSNVLTLLSIPVAMLGVTTRIHFTQIPILMAALGIGPLSGGLVGIIGAVSMVFSVTPPNPFIILYNGMLGLLAGLFNIIFRKRIKNLLVTHLASVIGAYIVQVPFIWILNTQVIGIPGVVAAVILVFLLFEDLASTVVSHVILYRVSLTDMSRKDTFIETERK